MGRNRGCKRRANELRLGNISTKVVETLFLVAGSPIPKKEALDPLVDNNIGRYF